MRQATQQETTVSTLRTQTEKAASAAAAEEAGQPRRQVCRRQLSRLPDRIELGG